LTARQGVIAVARENDYREREEIADRKKEVIDLCLSKLVTKGLAEITVRELSASLQLKKAGIYWYFKDKDEVIVLCAEEAANRLETNLILPVLQEIRNPDAMMKRLYDRADEMAPTMRYFVQVCATPKYRDEMSPVLSRLSKRYKFYATRFAEELGCKEEQVEPYFGMCISAMTNYMLFGDNYCVFTAMAMLREKLKELIDH